MPDAPTVALTGATGFIGRSISDRLLRHGWRVRALVRPASPHSDRLMPGCEPVEVALTPGNTALKEALRGADALVHAAGAVRGQGYADFRAANVDSVRAAAQALAAVAPDTPMLLMSSLAASRPELSAYARSKRDGEAVLAAQSGIRWTVLRPPAVYGPGDREMRPLFDWLRRGIAPIVGPRERRLSLIHVADLAAAVQAWVAAPQEAAGGYFAIDDGRPGGYDWDALIAAAAGGRARRVPVPRALLMTLGAINSAAARVTGYSPMLTPGKVREVCHPEWLCDNRAFSAATGWQPRIDLAEGLTRLD